MEIDDKWISEISSELSAVILEMAGVHESMMRVHERVAKMIHGERPEPIVSADGPPPAPHGFFDFEEKEEEGCDVPGAVIVQGDYTGPEKVPDVPEGG